MNRLHNKKSVILVLIGICILQLALSVFWGSKKNYLFFDEVFSYASANNTVGPGMEFPANQWMDETWYLDYMTADANHRFEYAIPYNNQVRDVHPPLFYLFLHTASSFVPEQFSYWAGIGFNILFFIVCTIALYFLGKEIFNSDVCGLLVAFLYAVSYGGLNTMIYIRMYMLLTMMILLHALVYVKYMDREHISIRGYIFLILTMVGGVLSQYYFLLIAFFFGVWYTIKFLAERRYKVLVRYLISILISAGISLLIWPSMLKHLFGGHRGEEAAGSLLSLDGYFADLKEMFRIINNEMFTKLLPLILIAIVVLFAICWKRERHINKECCKKVLMLFFACAGYFFVVTKVAPYQVDRYVMPLYPLVYLLVVGGAYTFMSKLAPKKVTVTLCILGFGGLSMIHMIHSGIPYTYLKNQNNIERQAVVEEYCENYAFYISDNGECHFFDPSQMLRKYEGYYHVYDLTSVDQTIKDMKLVEGQQELIIYVSNECSMEDINGFLQKVFDGRLLDENNLLDEDDKWKVYLLEL